jgi:hypothetical protein
MVGFVYIIVSGGKWMMTCVSLKVVLYGVSFVVHSSSGMVRMVIVSWFSFVARWAQCIAFCVVSLLCGCAYPFPSHLCAKEVPLEPNMASLWKGE